jgi:hypothetical protein
MLLRSNQMHKLSKPELTALAALISFGMGVTEAANAADKTTDTTSKTTTETKNDDGSAKKEVKEVKSHSKAGKGKEMACGANMKGKEGKCGK